jgi:MPBQ/MSBQ methyltransferase
LAAQSVTLAACLYATITEGEAIMVNHEGSVAEHYRVGDLGRKILNALEQSGADMNTLAPVDLAPVDEFHMGGRAATEYIVNLMDVAKGSRVLDLGSGLGGLVRYFASERECIASGIDLTPDFVEVAQMLTERTGLTDRADFRTGSALDLPWDDASFDAAVNFHVAMNIADRPRLYSEAARVIRPGGVFAIYDVMKGESDGMLFPVPWSETPETNFLVNPAEMEDLLGEANFDVIYREDRSSIGIEHHKANIAKWVEAGTAPPLGIHLLTGETSSLKASNMITMLETDQIMLYIFIARRR